MMAAQSTRERSTAARDAAMGGSSGGKAVDVYCHFNKKIPTAPEKSSSLIILVYNNNVYSFLI